MSDAELFLGFVGILVGIILPLFRWNLECEYRLHASNAESRQTIARPSTDLLANHPYAKSKSGKRFRRAASGGELHV